MIKNARNFTLVGATGTIRHAKLNERNHIVVPVVALMEGVVWPSNAPGPEFVSAEALAATPTAWNGRICVPHHPQQADGADESGSANTLEVLETQAFGTVLNARFEGKTKKLHLEAWLDVEKAKALKGLPADVIKRLEDGKPIEVSVGAFVHMEEKSGEYNGEKYEAVWAIVVPDHLALLPEGVIGACSNKMGCGAPRTARVNVMKGLSGGGGYEVACEHEATTSEDDVKKRSLRERLASLFSFSQRSAEGLSDRDLRYELRRKVSDVEPGFMDVENVYQQDGYFIYSCYTSDVWHLYRRSFAIDGTSVTIGEDRVEVQPKVTFEPIAASAACTGDHDCGCGCTHPEEKHMTKAERIAALIANKRTKYTDADRPKLEGLSEDTLTAIEEALPTEDPAAATGGPATGAQAAPAPAGEAIATPAGQQATALAGAQGGAAAVPPKTAAQIEAEYLAAAPQGIKDILARHNATETRRKSELVAFLNAKQTRYPEDRLNGMTVSDLEDIAALVGGPVPVAGVDYTALSGGVAATSGGNGSNEVPAPPDMFASVRAAAGKK